jgi:N-acetyltransferase
VRKIWLAPASRGRGLAHALLDTARSHFVYGAHAVPRAQVAFSQPTRAGAALARSYTGRDDFLVYRL